MSLTIEAIDRTNRPFFAGVASDWDLSRPLSPSDISSIHAGMDRFGVLLFRDEQIDDGHQIAFSRSLGPIDQATGGIGTPEHRRLGMHLTDIFKLVKNESMLAGLILGIVGCDPRSRTGPAAPRVAQGKRDAALH